MSIKRTLIVPALALMLVLGLTVPVFAEEGDDATVSDRETIRAEEGTDDSVSITPEDDAKTRLERQEARIKERRAKMEAAIKERRAERKERLEGQRLARCENREQRINQLLDKSVDNAKRHLQVIQKIEEGIKKFYQEKSLTAEGYDAAVASADEKEADAIAAIDVMGTVEFDCATADGQKPAETITTLVHQRHQALKSYRTAVKDLLLVVKKALKDKAAEKPTGDETTKPKEEE